MTVQPKYSEFKTDLESRKLYGKVKMTSQFRANLQDFDKNESEKPLINMKETFTENGFVKITEHFGSFGNLLKTKENFYDNNGFVVKSITTEEDSDYKQVELIDRDTINNTQSHEILIDGILKYEYQIQFGKHDELERSIFIENGDSNIFSYNYKFDANNKIIHSEETSNNHNMDKNFAEYKYDENGHLIESITGTESYKSKTVNIYNGNRLIEVQYLNVTKDLKEELLSQIEFDNYFNATSEKSYQNATLNKEIKNEYEFDDYGNWIKKTVYFKDHFAQSKEFVPIYYESRVITYWE